MNKYKIQITQSDTYCVDIQANTEAEARELVAKYWNEIADNGTQHYYQDGDTTTEITTVYDVTNTDDPFNPMNEN